MSALVTSSSSSSSGYAHLYREILICGILVIIALTKGPSALYCRIHRTVLSMSGLIEVQYITADRLEFFLDPQFSSYVADWVGLLLVRICRCTTTAAHMKRSWQVLQSSHLSRQELLYWGNPVQGGWFNSVMSLKLSQPSIAGVGAGAELGNKLKLNMRLAISRGGYIRLISQIVSWQE